MVYTVYKIISLTVKTTDKKMSPVGKSNSSKGWDPNESKERQGVCVNDSQSDGNVLEKVRYRSPIKDSLRGK